MASSETARGAGRRGGGGRLHQERDVAPALAEGRQLEVEDGEAVEEILAQGRARGLGQHGAGGRGDDARGDRRSSWLPRRARSVPSCRTRRSLVWRAGSRSPISSRKSVPPAAASKRPSRRALAPVKAPLSWPKSSLSTSVAGKAAMFTATKGAPWRAAVLVDGARHQLLAGAALAGDEHRRPPRTAARPMAFHTASMRGARIR